MNPWLLAAFAVLLAAVPAAIQTFRGNAMDRVVGLELMSLIGPIALLLLAQAFQRTAYLDIALASALLAFGAGLVFVRFLERWL